MGIYHWKYNSRVIQQSSIPKHMIIYIYIYTWGEASKQARKDGLGQEDTSSKVME